MAVPGWLEQHCQQLPWWELLWGKHSGSLGKLVLKRTPLVTAHMWQLVLQRWTTGGLLLTQQADGSACSVPGTCVAMYANGPKWGNGDPPIGTDRPPDIIQVELPECCRVEAWGGSDLLPHFP